MKDWIRCGTLAGTLACGIALASPQTSAPKLEASRTDFGLVSSDKKPAAHLGISYGENGLPSGFDQLSFEQTDVDFQRQFQAPECLRYPRSSEHPGAPEACAATFRQQGRTVQISAWFVSGHLTSMAEIISTGCAAHSADFSERFAIQSRENTKMLAGEFLPYRGLPFAETTTVSAWSANDEFHVITACQSNDAGFVLLAKGSLTLIEQRVRHRRFR